MHQNHFRGDILKVFKVLIVDDDKVICKMITKSLKPENIVVVSANSEAEAIGYMESQTFDLIILDVMLGDTDGFEVFRRMQIKGIEAPVIFLSGKDQDYDKILALGMGADDYITKPFSLSVLIAKIKAHLRRGEKLKQAQNISRKIICEPFVLDIDTYQLFKGGTEIYCSSKEIMLMKFFMENPNKVFTKEQLYENVWKDSIIDNNSVMVYIRHLRKKIEDSPKEPKFLETVWGIGYKFSI